MLASWSRCCPHVPVLGKKGSIELRRVVCSINYDANNGSASHGRVKGEGCQWFFMKPKLFSWKM